jgi:predicted nucleotidyltransferase
MLTHAQIENVISRIAPKYNVKSVSYFGSYALGKQTDDSDLDLLVEFTNPFVSLYDLISIEEEIENSLNIPVDIATYPLPIGSKLMIEKAVNVYGA